MNAQTTTAQLAQDDPLMSSSALRKELGDVSLMTIWRWKKNGTLPPPVKINGRDYWRKSVVEAVKSGRAQQ